MEIPKDFVARFYLEEGAEIPNSKMRQVLIGDFVRKIGMLEEKIEPLFDNWNEEYENFIAENTGNIYKLDYCEFLIEKMKPHIEAVNALPGRINLVIEEGEDFDFYGVVKNNDKIRIKIFGKEEV